MSKFQLKIFFRAAYDLKLVFLQFFIISLHFFQWEFLPQKQIIQASAFSYSLGILIIIIAFIMMLVSIKDLGRNLSPFPRPINNSNLVTSGINIFLLELLLLYFASATSIALTGPGIFSLDEVIIRILKSEDEEEIIPSTKAKPSKQVEVKEETSKGGLFQFLQANILSDTSS